MPQRRRSIAQSQCNSSEQSRLNSHFMRIGLFTKKTAGKSNELNNSFNCDRFAISRH
jgi:hypothetical protein